MLGRTAVDPRSENGVMLVLFALLVPLVLIIGSVVVSTGSWYTHGKHLQTKVDAAAFAGGGSWAFPCAADIDANIESFARQYVGQHTKADGTPYSATTYNPQVGKVQGDKIHVVLNGPDYYDGDTNPNPSEPPLVGSVCNAKYLDVKATEQDSPLLWGWLPFSPDIKKKARIEIQEVDGLTGLLPIAMRAPEPVSAAAVFYSETSAQKTILGVKYFVKNGGIFGIPPNLQGWSTFNTEDSSTWASFAPAGATGVVVAVSFRGACNTNLPNPNTKIRTSPAPCFEDQGFTTVNQLCNQGATLQIVDCSYATGGWPSVSTQSGLHFIRGYPTGNVGQGRPEIRSAWLENLDCPANGYFSATPGSSPCNVKLVVKIDVGSKVENPLPNPPNNQEQTRLATNTEVKYCLVLRGQTANNACNSQFGTAQELNGTGGPGEVTFQTVAGKHLQVPRNSNGAAVAIQVRMKDTSIAGESGCNLTTNNDFTNQCRFFYTGAGFTSTSVAPSGAAILANPVQRSFRGNSLTASSVRWLRLTADRTCDGTPDFIDNEAASQPTGGNRCFFMDMGVKGGVALDQDEPAVLFDDGTGTSQVGAVHCDPSISQGQILEDGIIQGCKPWYAPNRFDTVPLCPKQNEIFNTPNPGPPWQDWPPLRCIKTRPTGQGGQMDKGFNQRFFGVKNNPSCPTDSAAGPVKGRNYWDKDTNLYKGASYADNGPPATGNNLRDSDPRLVTIFLAPSNAFTGTGQDTYPVTGFIGVYITGYGRVSGNGSLTIDDPCPGSTPPPDLDLSGGSSGGYVVWGHVINHVVPGPDSRPSGRICRPVETTNVCVPVLVE